MCAAGRSACTGPGAPRRVPHRLAELVRLFLEQRRLVPPPVLESVSQQGALPLGHHRHVALAGLPLGPAKPHQLVAGVGALGPRRGAQLGPGRDAERRARGVVRLELRQQFVAREQPSCAMMSLARTCGSSCRTRALAAAVITRCSSELALIPLGDGCKNRRCANGTGSSAMAFARNQRQRDLRRKDRPTWSSARSAVKRPPSTHATSTKGASGSSCRLCTTSRRPRRRSRAPEALAARGDREYPFS